MSIKHPRIQARILALFGFSHASLILIRVFIETRIREITDLEPRCSLSDCFGWLKRRGLLTGSERKTIRKALYVCSQAAHGAFITDFKRKHRNAFKAAAMVARLRGEA